MRNESRDWIVCSGHFREDLRLGAVVERAGIRHLPAGFGVNRGADQHYLAALTALQFADWLVFCQNRFDARVLGACPVVKRRLRFESLSQLRKSRICTLFVRTL